MSEDRTPPEEKRVKVFQVSRQALLNILNGVVFTQDYITLPLVDGIPPTSRVEQIWDDHASRCLCLLVSDRSFDLVPAGECPPVVPGLNTVKQVEVFKRQEDGSYLPVKPGTTKDGSS